MPEIDVWADTQRQVLVDLGVHPRDAATDVQWVVDSMPAGEDPDTWIPTQEIPAAVTRNDPVATVDAKAVWMEDETVPARYNMILSATPAADEDEAESIKDDLIIAGLLTYLFLRNRRQYYTVKPFQPVAALRIRTLLDAHVSSSQALVNDLVTAFHEGRLAPAVWDRHMETVLRRENLHYRSLGGGGFNNLDEGDSLAVDARLREDYGRLRTFAAAVLAGSMTILVAQNRAGMYVGSARTQFWEALREKVLRRPGYVTLKRRHLSPADHCSDCVQYYDKGYTYPNDTPSPGIGSECRSNCRCFETYRDVATNEVDDWLGTKR